MSADRVDVVIIGAGLAGSATAWALARRGRSAVVLEAFQPGHRRGSSHGRARIFRRSYPDPLYVQLTGEAQRLWRQLADEAGEELILSTGGIDFGPAREQECGRDSKGGPDHGADHEQKPGAARFVGEHERLGEPARFVELDVHGVVFAREQGQADPVVNALIGAYRNWSFDPGERLVGASISRRRSTAACCRIRPCPAGPAHARSRCA